MKLSLLNVDIQDMKDIVDIVMDLNMLDVS